MANVQEIISRKGSNVLIVRPQTSVLDASKLMNQHKVGALVVVEDERVCGMFTERDIMQRVVAEQRDPALTRVREVMTQRINTCSPTDSVGQARSTFMEKRIRHLPVLDENERLVGMISIGDLNAWELSGQQSTIAALEEYLYGTM